MGVGCTSGEMHRDDTSKRIESDMSQLQKTLNGQVKILLLGTGESGKSTVFKQMKIIQDDGGFTEEELLSYKDQVYNNCITQMRAMLEAVISLRHPLAKKESLEYAQQIMKLTRDAVWTKEIGDTLKALWEDSGIQDIYTKRGKLYQLNDTANYFLDNLNRINIDNYIPTLEDVLRVRIRSTGIEEAEFRFDKKLFKVIDVGGQRSERRKWIHCFDGVTAVLFCSSLADYDLPLREDPRQNRLSESIMLFTEICNQDTFLNKSLIFFLNKKDLLTEKLPTHPLQQWQPDFKPPQSDDKEVNFEAATEFIKNLFLGQVDTTKRPLTSIYTHYTCALDTEHIEVVIKTVRKKLLDDVFQNMGLE